MVTVTSIGGRVAVLAASALAHVALAAAAVTGGHAPESARAATTTTTAEISVEALPPEPPLEEPVAPRTPVTPGAASPPPTHTHPYPVPPDHDAHPHDPSLVHAAFAPTAHDDDHARAPTELPREAPAIAAAAPDAPRFTIVSGAANVSFGAVAPGTSGASGASVNAAHGDEGGPIVEATSLAEPAKRLAWSEPEYPEAAKAAGIEAEIPVEIVIDAHGAVESARATRHAGYGLDEAATRAVRSWRFSPRTVAGRAVRVRLVCPVVFRLTN